jgi:hypothetical protein
MDGWVDGEKDTPLLLQKLSCFQRVYTIGVVFVVSSDERYLW